MLVDILRLIFIAGGLVFIFMLVQACWRKKQSGSFEATPFWPVALIGGVANFLDTLGVGSFAVKTACYKQFKLIDDSSAAGYPQWAVRAADRDSVADLRRCSRGGAADADQHDDGRRSGRSLGARHVASFDWQTIRLVMAISLLVVAGLIFAGLLGLFPVGGDAMGLSGYKLAIALLGNFIFGVLMNVGIGLFAPA